LHSKAVVNAKDIVKATKLFQDFDTLWEYSKPADLTNFIASTSPKIQASAA
jgi:hypothetical protein